MRAVQFGLSHFAAVAGLALLSYCIGRRLTSRFVYHSHLEELSFSVALGIGTIAYGVFFLGLFDLLYKWVALAALGAGLAACYQVWLGFLLGLWKQGFKLGKAIKRKTVIVAAVVLLVITLARPIWILPLYPPTAFDSTMYHLTLAKVYVQRHGLLLTPYLRLATSTQTNQMLFTLALLIYDDILAQLIQFLIMLTLSTALIAFGERFFAFRAGFWAAAMLLSNPLVLWLGSVCYVDIAVMLFVWMSIYAFYIWMQLADRKWLVLAAVFCGLAMGTKYNAAFFLVALGAAALYKGFKERKYLEPVSFVVLSLLVASPWLIRNFYYTRNPIYPFFYKTFASWFGYGFLEPEYYLGFFEDIPMHRTGISLAGLLMLPWHLASSSQNFYSEMPLAWLPSIALPLVFILGLAASRMRLLALLGVAFVLFWFFSIQVMRYLAPIFPLLCLLAAALMDRILSRAKFLSGPRIASAITIVGFVVLIYTGWRHNAQLFESQGMPPVTEAQRHSYLARSFPTYQGYKFLNELRGSSYNLFSVQDENLAYYADGFRMGDYFGPARYTRIIGKLNDPEALHSELRRLQVDYLLINPSRNTIRPSRDGSFRLYFKRIYWESEVEVFELRQ